MVWGTFVRHTYRFEFGNRMYLTNMKQELPLSNTPKSKSIAKNRHHPSNIYLVPVYNVLAATFPFRLDRIKAPVFVHVHAWFDSAFDAAGLDVRKPLAPASLARQLFKFTYAGSKILHT